MAADGSRAERQARPRGFRSLFQIDRPLLLKSIEYSLKPHQFQLDYSQDELDQLEKMYEADDLTEDTEEIVLKRSADRGRFRQVHSRANEAILRRPAPRFVCHATKSDMKESLDKAGRRYGPGEGALALDLNRPATILNNNAETVRRSRSIATPSCSPIGR